MDHVVQIAMRNSQVAQSFQPLKGLGFDIDVLGAACDLLAVALLVARFIVDAVHRGGTLFQARDAANRAGRLSHLNVDSAWTERDAHSGQTRYPSLAVEQAECCRR